MQDELAPNDLAIVIGARGGIGAALLETLRTDPRWPHVIGFARPELDLLDERSIAAAAASLAGRHPRLIIDATGHLHDPDGTPERSWRQIDPAHMARSYAINAIGPALLMKHFLPLLPRQGRSVFATLSARVGSIGDRGVGGA